MKRIEELETPAIVVDASTLRENIQKMSAYAATRGLKVRPHTKTHKIPEIAHLQVASGCSGITVAKTCEAKVMADAGLDDILVHYPVFGTAKLERLAEIARARRIAVAIDSLTTAEAVSAIASAKGSTIGLLVEFDVGLRRCGVASPEDGKALAIAIEKLPGVSFQGISVYPGHIFSSPADQGPALAEVSARVAEITGVLSAAGIACEIVSGGSTPTAYQSHQITGLTEIRPGTYVFNDRNTLDAGACSLSQCALRVHVTVVSNAVAGRAMVDGGSKTFSSDRLLSGAKEGFGYVVEHPEIRFAGMSEEHGHLDLSESDYRPKIGDRLTIIPNHVCACVNLHNQIHYHSDGLVQGVWEVAARGRVQ
jgi:D-serine deaminase-like pyridoxal phosphate-dependent protein